MHYDRLGTEFRFDHLSGDDLERCAFVGYRRDPLGMIDAAFMESWVVQPTEARTDKGRTVRVEVGIPSYLTGLWYSPSGRIYAVELHGRMFVLEVDVWTQAREWRAHDWGEGIELHGVWGLHDDLVFVWGRDIDGPRLWRIAGGEITAMPAPEMPITLLRGCPPSTLYAAGPDGYLARWESGRWVRVPIRSARPATGLCVVSEDEAWLTTDAGKLFEGTSYGWALRTEVDAPICDVMRWRDRLLLAAKDLGVLELDGRTDRTRPLLAGVPAIALAGGDRGLLALTEDYLVFSPDGVATHAACRAAVHAIRAGKTPAWQERS